MLLRTATRGRRRQQRLDHRPLLIAQIGRIPLTLLLGTLAHTTPRSRQHRTTPSVPTHLKHVLRDRYQRLPNRANPSVHLMNRGRSGTTLEPSVSDASQRAKTEAASAGRSLCPRPLPPRAARQLPDAKYQSQSPRSGRALERVAGDPGAATTRCGRRPLWRTSPGIEHPRKRCHGFPSR